MVNINSLNPFSNFNIGVGAIGNALILMAISVVVISLVGVIVYWRVSSKAYNKKIPLYKSINGINYLQATYSAKNVPISKAGDSLWFAKGIKKFLAPATKTTAPNTYPHEEREDGEWINFEIETVNEQQKMAGVKFIQQDMRTQRVATGQILEQRLINKNFWEKYKDILVYLAFFIIVTLLMIVTFWQWGGIVDKIGFLVDRLDSNLAKLNELECVGIKEVGIVPSLLFFTLRRRKK